MKSILKLVEAYLRKYPAPSSIDMLSDSALKLTYTYSVPYTDSKSTKDVILPTKPINELNVLSYVADKLSYNEKGRI